MQTKVSFFSTKWSKTVLLEKTGRLFLLLILLLSLLGTSTANVYALGGDVTPPTLTITGATADGNPMGGDLDNGYVLDTTNKPAVDHLIQFAAGTSADEPLADTYFGLYLTNSTVSASDIKTYYDNRGVPEPFLTYLKAAVDGTNPFVYIKGTTVKLVDAAKHDILAVDVDMTVPDDFPLGTYTVEGQISDLAGNKTDVTLKLIVDGDRTSPTLNITGATADGNPMSGDVDNGFVLRVTNNPAVDHLIQFAAGTDADEPLANEYFGLYLTDSTVSGSDIKTYYDNRGVPEPFLTYLKAAVDGTNPFVYIKGSTVTLVDAAKHDILAVDVDMTIPDDFPLGTYTVSGKIKDLAGNETEVTLTLIVTDDSTPPVVVSVALADPNPTSAAEVEFTVSFSESVTGVDALDFTITKTGDITGYAITKVSPPNCQSTLYTVAVATGSGSGTLRLDVLNNGSIQDVVLNPLAAGFSAGSAYTVVKDFGRSFRSRGKYDGIVQKDFALDGGKKISVGDLGKKNDARRGILHFNTKHLPNNATITSVKLYLKHAYTKGDPFGDLGDLVVDLRKPFFGKSKYIHVKDFNAKADKTNAPYSIKKVKSWYVITLKPSAFKYINLKGTTQIRLSFEKQSDYDYSADLFFFYSGTTNKMRRPKLIIEYSVP